MKTQFLTDNKGNRTAVLLSIKEYEKMVEEIEELDDIKMYDKVKKEDDGKRILFTDYLKNRKLKNG